MRKLTTTAWIVAACGWLAGAAGASEPGAVLNADAVFAPNQGNLIQQVNCDACCPSGGHGCGGGGGLFGGDMGDPWAMGSMLGDDSPLDIGGWVSAGYHNNPNGLFNSHPHNFNAHQVWLYAGKEADGSEGFDWGFRIDAMYGVDGPDTQSFGNPVGVYDFSDTFNHGDLPGQSSHGWAIPQLYGEVAFGDASIIAGHFYTLVGYEVVQAPDNFFYSHAFTQYLSEPFTHTGILGTYAVSDNVEVYGGWTLGWDTGFSQLNSGNNFLGGASVSLLDNVSVTYILTAGNFGWIGEGYSHSIVGDVQITDKLNYVIQSDLVHTNVDPFGNTDGYNTIGLNQYLIYWMTDRVGAGARAEWWKANGVSYYEITAGVNFKPHPNLVIRPEFRYQWSPAGSDNAAQNVAGLPLDQGIFGVDAILVF